MVEIECHYRSEELTDVSDKLFVSTQTISLSTQVTDKTGNLHSCDYRLFQADIKNIYQRILPVSIFYGVFVVVVVFQQFNTKLIQLQEHTHTKKEDLHKMGQ